MTSHGPSRNEQNELDDWMKVLDRLPFVGSVKRDLTALRQLLYDRRAPRVAVVGAHPAGRMALANGLLTAIAFGPGGAAPAAREGQWVHVDADGRRLDWLELPVSEGVVEIARPALDDSLPDAIVALVRATAATEEAKPAADAAGALRDYLKQERDHDAPILFVLDAVEALPPHHAAPADKPDTIALALREAREAAYALKLEDDRFHAVSTTPPRHDLTALGESLLAQIPESAQLEAVRAFEVGREARRGVARAVVNSCTALALTVGLAPVPFADAFILVPLQAAMVTAIAYVSGRPWDRRAASEWIASLGGAAGAGLGLRWGARQLAKLVPGAGSLVGASFASAGTLAIGRSAMAYFIDGPGRLGERKELRADNP